MLLQPSPASLSDSRTVNMMWTPDVSVSVSQKRRTLPAHMKPNPNEPNPPHITLQILDTTADKYSNKE